MKVSDLVILVKYGQGLVLFNSYFEHLKFLKPPVRKVFLLQVVQLINKLHPQKSDADTAIKESKLDVDCKPCLLLKQGIEREKLQEILDLPEEELEPSFKLLLSLFTVVYQKQYKQHKNAPDKFWYWDYLKTSNTINMLNRNDKEVIDVEKFNF